MRFITERGLKKNLENVVSYVTPEELCTRGILNERDGKYFVCDDRGKPRNFRVRSGGKVYLGEDRRRYEVVLKKAD